MNEGVISGYEQLFGGSGLPSDLAIEMAAVTSIHAAIATDFHKEIGPQQSQHQYSRTFQNPSTYKNLMGTTCDITTQNIAPTQRIFACNNSATFIGNSGSNNVFTQIPFVQIHTTDVQPQSTFNSIRFRRNVGNNQEEIKAEPIKSENSEGAKDRVNGTPTPPVSVQQRSESQTSKNFTQNEKEVYPDLETTRGVSDELIDQNTKTCTTERTSFTSPDIYKCQHCAFISLNERGLQIHVDSTFQGSPLVCQNAFSRRKLHCPGCENVFYTYSVVEIHLREDHLMSEQDVIEFMQIIKKTNIPFRQSDSTNNVRDSVIEVSNETSIKGTHRRSRIYLKNVECLREPNRDPIEQQDNLINDSLFHFESVECNTLENIGSISMEEQDLIGILTSGEATFQNKGDNIVDNIVNETITPTLETNKSANPPKQKISIKSVDVLREPALVRRDYEMQSFGEFINVCNDLNLHLPNNNSNNNNNETSNCDNHCGINDTDGQYIYSVAPNTESLVGNNDDVAIADFTIDFEKPRRPKIYIKNVDILKEPMTFSSNISAPTTTESTNNTMNFNFMQPTIPHTVTSYLDTVDSLNATVPPFNSGMSQLPLGTISDQYLFDSGGGNFLVNSSTPVSENYTYGNDQTSENFLMDSNRFIDAITPMTTEPTPPPPTMSTAVSNTNNCTAEAQHTQNAAITNVQKQKIFIKNVDILKEPQFQEPRGLLHLRTVDELNLMNRKEVENLIAPNLEGNQTNLAEEELGDNYARLSNANGETLSSIENCSTSNLIEAISYDCEGFKLNEFSTQNGWHDDYDLGDDIREIITSTMAPILSSAQKTINELDTSQISLISIPDIEELTGTSAEVNPSLEAETCGNPTIASDVTQQQLSTNFTFECEISTANNNSEEPVCSSENLGNSTEICSEVISEPQAEPESTDTALLENAEALKQERLNQSTPGENTDPTPSQKTKVNNFDEIPPLTPMTSTTYAICTNLNTSTSIAVPTGLPVPPLVPMLPSKAVSLTNVGTPANATERGRIYVANNLMQTPNTAPISQTAKAQTPKSKSNNMKRLDKEQSKTPIAVSVMGGTSVRGRPFGSNRAGITKLRKQPINESGPGVYLKCTVTGCAFRFKKSNTVDYHIKCHSSESSPQSMACPECKTSFTNWNSLHTHLWRTHKIDMELYSCELCSFKTPIYSRLLNTHSKIHYDERNYKCDQCEKAFKNTKQLKNHRRWHRNHNKFSTSTSPSAKREISKKADESPLECGGSTQLSPTTSSTSPSDATQVPETPVRNFYRCKDCEAVFSYQKTLREHLCKNAAAAVHCELCDRVLTSRSSIKLHMQLHEPSRRFKCNDCDYSASDHNAFRRHKMTHDNNAKMYACVYCDYKSIQSVAYQKHVQQKHPQVADSIVYKCKICPYATINKGLFDVHQVKHENKNVNNEATAAILMENVDVEKSRAVTTKIKVKSHLLLTTSVDSATELNELCFDSVTMPS